MAKKIEWLSADGLLNVEEFVALTREMDKVLGKEGMKCNEIYFAPKVIPKFDKAKAKAGAEAFTKKRALVIKVKTRMPPAGSRMRMVVLLKNWKGIEDTDFASDFNSAKKAIDAHNKVAEKFITKHKAEGAKKRDVANKQFDKALAAMEDVLEAAGLDLDKSVAIGQSMMGKTMIVKLPGGHFVSIGKADEEKFEKAQESESGEDEAPAKRKVGAKKAGKEEKSSKKVKSSKADKEEKSSSKKVKKGDKEEKSSKKSKLSAKPAKKLR